jgi:uncharacterized protein involved in exopolysaccharide biosynthesis
VQESQALATEILPREEKYQSMRAPRAAELTKEYEIQRQMYTTEVQRFREAVMEEFEKKSAVCVAWPTTAQQISTLTR